MEEDELRQLRHDLRSPLVVISGFGQLLAGEAELDPRDRREYADRIIRAAQDLEGLIDRL